MTDLQRLQTTLTSILHLTTHLLSSLPTLTTDSPTTADSATTPTPTQPPPLQLLHTTSTLLRANVTKLALVLTQSPNVTTSASATVKLLLTLQNPILLSLVAPLPLLHNQKALQRAAFPHVSTLLRHLEHLLRVTERELAAERESAEGKEGKKDGNRRAAFEGEVRAATGRIWDACDALISLRDKGLAGVVAGRVRCCVETVGDAGKELERWIERRTPKRAVGGSVSSSSSAADSDNDDDEEDGEYDDDDDFWWDDDIDEDLVSRPKKVNFLSEQKIAAINVTLKRIKTAQLLLSAVVKRRLMPPSAPSPDPSQSCTPDLEIVKRVEKFMELADAVVELVDDVVGEEYDYEEEDEAEGGNGNQNGPDTRVAVRKLIETAAELAGLADLGWAGREDAASKLFRECAKAIGR